jgi:hypothetical protein
MWQPLKPSIEKPGEALSKTQVNDYNLMIIKQCERSIMGITVAWDDEGNIIYNFAGEWSWEDLHAAEMTARQMLTMVEHPVYFVFDIEAGQVLPRNVLSYIRHAPMHLGANDGGRVIVAGASRYMRTIYDLAAMFRPAFRERFVLVPDIQAAYSYLDDIRQARSGGS